MNITVERQERLEGRFERLLLKVHKLEAQVAALNSQIQLLQGQQSGGGGGGGAGVFSIPGVVIAAGGNVTGQTVSVLSSGSLSTVTTTGTVYNQMAVPTVVGKLIICGQNPDGSFTAITQSC